MIPVLQATGITKKFSHVIANDHVDFSLRKGEIHALLGESGAGKTTLMNIFYGLCQPDEGEIRVNGIPTHLESPNDAIYHGIGMVHQHLMLIPVLTACENIILGQEQVLTYTKKLRGLAVLDRRKASRRIRELSSQYDLRFDPDMVVRDMTVVEKQRVEIIKALYRDADTLILDEPAALLSLPEADDLFIILRTLVFQGKSIIFVSSKPEEVLKIADRISVMCSGRITGPFPSIEASPEELVKMMHFKHIQETKERDPGEL
jgi:general nucleoside transport system ATP-binding protein